jgi:3-oxoacyl-[acyl-carrier protein] reductase
MAKRVAIVTGAAHPKGIGRAIVRRLAADGYTVIAADLEGADGLESIDKEPGDVRPAGCDVTSRDQIDATVDRAVTRLGGVDVLVNNAGVGTGDPDFMAITDNDWNLSLAVNLKGAADFMQAVVPALRARGGGVIVNVASLAGLGAMASIPANYTASKFAVVGLTKQVALQLAPEQIRCNAVCPGSVVTQMHEVTLTNLMTEHAISREEAQALEAAAVPVGYSAAPEEVASVVSFLCSDAARYLTGVALPVAGGMAPGL